MKREVRSGSGGAEFGCLVVSFVSSGSALIGSHSPVSRSSSFRQLHTFSPFSVLLAFLFWFWLGLLLTIARTPTTTLFQYAFRISSFNELLVISYFEHPCVFNSGPCRLKQCFQKRGQVICFPYPRMAIWGGTELLYSTLNPYSLLELQGLM